MSNNTTVTSALRRIEVDNKSNVIRLSPQQFYAAIENQNRVLSLVSYVSFVCILNPQTTVNKCVIIINFYQR